jgi:hypothetical protein
MAHESVTGYDGSTFTVGDRIELHPGCDLWVRGARFGTVVGLSLTPADRVKVKLDRTGEKLWSCPADRLRSAR